LKVRTATANGTLERDHAVAERWARRPFRRADPQVLDGLLPDPETMTLRSTEGSELRTVADGTRLG
jgi:hypothetical protein